MARKADEKYQRPLDEIEYELAGVHTQVLEAMEAHHKGKRLDKYGREVLDPVPVAPPIGYQKQPTMVEVIRQMVRQQTAIFAQDQELETFEDADDFDTHDDDDFHSQYEEVFEPTPTQELQRRRAEARDRDPDENEPMPLKTENAPQAKPGEAPKTDPGA